MKTTDNSSLQYSILYLLAALTLSTQPAVAKNQKYLDLRKTIVETNVKSFIKAPSLTVPKKSHKRSAFKATVRHMISLDESKILSPKGAKPGLVNWHGTMKSSMKAAKSSGKPIFVFQLMGDLDDEFC